MDWLNILSNARTFLFLLMEVKVWRLLRKNCFIGKWAMRRSACWKNDSLSGETVRRPAEQDAVKILAAIQRLRSRPGLSDFDRVKEIVSIFEEYGLDSGCCHDLG